MSIKLVRLFPELFNIKPFVIGDHPIYHPETKDYLDYWEEQEKRCIEGLWGLDKSEKGGGWRFCPPVLYYYINFCVIEHEDERNNSTIILPPSLRDVEWLFFYNWFICRGFSGFEGDYEYTCHELIRKLESGEKLNTKEILKLQRAEGVLKPDGSYKKFIHPREYLYKTFDKPLGLPLYANEAKNLMALTPRRQGKSMWLMAILSHAFKFHGAIRFDQEYFNLTRGPSILIGSVLAKAADTLKHFSFLEEYQKHNFGAWGDGDDFIPGYFFQQVSGSLTVSNQKSPYRNEYEERINGVVTKQGKGTRIVHVTYEDNPEAAVGQGPIISIIEEVGLLISLLKVLGANEPGLTRNNKFGSHLLIGCVCAGTKVWDKNGNLCNIEDINKTTGILGHYAGEYSIEEVTNVQKPTLKECYRLTLEGGNSLECSWDHPIFSTSAHLKYRKDGNTYRDAVYVEAQDLTTDDYVFLVDKIDKFGNHKEKYARLLGLMVGDGYYGRIHQISVCTDQKGIQNYIESIENTKIKKQFLIPKNNEQFIEYSIKNKEVRKILSSNGMLGQTRDKKQLPANIGEYDKQSLADFIGGYFDADGCVVYNETKKKLKIQLTSKYRHLLEDVKFYLTKFGIDSTIGKEKRNGGYINNDSTYYSLYITKNKDVIRFKRNITLLSEYKQKTLFKEIKANREFKRWNVITKNSNNNVEKSFTGLITKKIKKIENIGEKEVYNLTANTTHTYLANNIVTHNTAGNMERIFESKMVFEEPETYKFLGFEDLWENRQKEIGLFIPGYYVDNALRDPQGNQNLEAAFELEMQERARLSKADNSYALDAYMMARPLVPSEMFLSGQSNIFPVSLLRDQLNRVEIRDLFNSLTYKGELEWNESKTGVKLKLDFNNQLKPIISMKLDQYKSSLKGCIVFYEAPEENIPIPTQKRSLYKIVYDPVRDDVVGTSLAAILVYKSTSEDGWALGLQDALVAEYIGRVDKVDDMHQIAIKLAIYYNAKIMVETNIPDFVRYCKNNGFAHLLQRKPMKTISKSVKDPGNKYEVGIDMTSPALHEHAEQLGRQWLLTEWKTDSTGETLLNLHKLNSPMILQQLMMYTREDKKRYDAVAALKLLWLWLKEEKEEPVKQEAREAAIETVEMYYNKLTRKQQTTNVNYYTY